MIKNVLTHIGGIEVYGIISICLFFAVFTGALVWAALVRKSFADRMSGLPLDDGSHNSNKEGTSHHE